MIVVRRPEIGRSYNDLDGDNNELNKRMIKIILISMFSKSEQENYTVDLTPTFFNGPIDIEKSR